MHQGVSLRVHMSQMRCLGKAQLSDYSITASQRLYVSHFLSFDCVGFLFVFQRKYEASLPC